MRSRRLAMAGRRARAAFETNDRGSKRAALRQAGATERRPLCRALRRAGVGVAGRLPDLLCDI